MIYIYYFLLVFQMSKLLFKSCSNNLRDSLKPLATTEEIFRLKQYAIDQKQLAFRLIKYQRWVTSNYHHRRPIHSKSIESNHEQGQPSNDSSPSIPPIGQLNIPIIKIDHCSSLIATGYGIANDRSLSSLIDIHTELSHSPIFNEDISLSKASHLTNRHVQ